MHMTPEIAEQNAIDQLRVDAEKLLDEAKQRQQALDEQISSGQGELPESPGTPKESKEKDEKEEKPSKT